MKKLLTFLTLLTLSIGVGWAETVVFTPSTVNGTQSGNTQSYDEMTSGGITISTTKGQFGRTTDYRIYSGGELTISSSVGNITKVEITKNGSYDLTILSGDGYDGTGTTGIWIGNDESLTLTASAQIRIDKIEVTYSTSSSVATPTFSPAAGTYTSAQNVTISCATPDATIHYTTDGSTPTASSPTYNSAINVSSTTTIKAMAVKSGMTNSSIATATYTFPETVTPTYEEPFASTFGKFYREDITGSGIWSLDASYHYAKASGYVSGSNTASESWLISPYIDLTGASNPELSFSHAGNYFTNTANMQSDVVVKVKKQGDATWSDLTVNTWPDGNSWTWADNTTSLSSYAGEVIQIAFVYTSTTSRAGTWEIKNFVIEDLSAPKYYLYGTFNGWNTQDENYKFNLSNGTYSITGVDLPDNVRFKISKVVNGQVTEYGADNGGADYGINGGWNSNIPMNGANAYTIASGALTNITLNTTNMTFNVSRDAQFFVKGDFNGWNREAMTATASGWTIEHVISSANQFGFVDEWGYWYGGRDWWIQEEHLGNALEIKPDGNFYMNIAGTDDYTLTVNSAKTTLTVSKIEVIASDEYVLVTDVDDLDTSSSFIIVSKENAMAMAEQRTQNNRAGKAITLKENGTKAVPDEDIVELFSLETGTGGWYLKATNISPGYLYAGSSNGNQLKTSDQIDSNGNSLATISINGSTGVASIKFQGTNTRNTLQFNLNNNNPPIFNCYSSASQQPVYLYKKVEAVERATPPVITPASQNVKGGLLEGVMITAAEGATIHYTRDGSEPTVDSEVFDGQAFNITGAGGERKMVRAIAVEANKAPSYPASVTYTFQAPATPTISPAAGTYDEAVTVTITSTDGGIIYYLVNPEEAPINAAAVISDGQVYTEGETEITLSDIGTYKVYAAINLNGITSWAQATYTITVPPTEMTLAEILEERQPGKTYTVSDELIAVAAGFDGGTFILWCKDQYDEGEDPTAIDAVENENDYIDYMKKHGGFEGEWDQSNWIALLFLTDDGDETYMSLEDIIAFYSDLKSHEGWRIKPRTITGDFSSPVQPYLLMNIDFTNPEIPFEFEANGNVGYSPNLYCPANFLRENLDSYAEGGDGAIGHHPATGEEIHYFFMTPKVNEICDVTFAVWNGEYFTVPSPQGDMNNTNIPGAFKADMYYSEIAFTDNVEEPIIVYDPEEDLEVGQAYKFRAAIGYYVDPGIVPTKNGDRDNPQYDIEGYRVYPLDFDPKDGDNIVTSIENVNVFEGNSYVKSIKYVNVAGMVSDKPFQGMNIVVIENTDGSKTTYKMISK